MIFSKRALRGCALAATLAARCWSQTGPPDGSPQPTVQMLLDRLAKAEAGIRQLEELEASRNGGGNLVATTAPAGAPVVAALNAATPVPARAMTAPGAETRVTGVSSGDPQAVLLTKIRWEVSEFAAFKLQYNRLDQRLAASNSVDAQIGMTF